VFAVPWLRVECAEFVSRYNASHYCGAPLNFGDTNSAPFYSKPDRQTLGLTPLVQTDDSKSELILRNIAATLVMGAGRNVPLLYACRTYTFRCDGGRINFTALLPGRGFGHHGAAQNSVIRFPASYACKTAGPAPRRRRTVFCWLRLPRQCHRCTLRRNRGRSPG